MPERSALTAGTRVGPWEVLSPLGHGGRSRVYLAASPQTGERVALKLLPPELQQDENARRRLQREFESLQRVTGHPNICRCVALHLDGPVPALAVELVEGPSLAERLEPGPLPVGEALAIATGLARGLATAHEAGLVHRDLKPSNVLLGEDGQPRIIDFGIAHAAEWSRMTMTGLSSGTPLYMSPEQLTDGVAGPATDVWGLGLVLYEMLSGVHPFEAESSGEVGGRILASPLPPLRISGPGGKELAALVQRCLAKDPAHRPADGAALLGELGALAGRVHPQRTQVLGVGRRRRSRSPWVASAAALLVLAILFLPGTGDTPAPPSPTALAPGQALQLLPFEVQEAPGLGGELGLFAARSLSTQLASVYGIPVLPVVASDTRADHRPIVRGRVWMEGDSLHLSAQLLESAEDAASWQSTVEGARSGLSALSAELASQLATALGAPPVHRYRYFREVLGSEVTASWPGLPDVIGALERRDVDAALEGTARLVEAFPDDYSARVMRLAALTFQGARDGHAPETVRMMEEARREIARIDPHAPIVEIAATWENPDVEGSLARIERLLTRRDLSPGARSHALRTYAHILGRAGRTDEALEAIEEAIQVDPSNPYNYSYGRGISLRGNRPEEALRWAQRFALMVPGLSNFELAIIQARMGLEDEALATLEEMFEMGYSPPRDVIEGDPDLAVLHGRPRFQALLARAPLEGGWMRRQPEG